MSKIGDYLKNLREQKELSTVEVQKLSNGRISQSYVVQVEQGVRTPSVSKLEAFADVYGISVHDLVDVMIDAKKKQKREPPVVLSGTEIRLIRQIRELPEYKQKALFQLLQT